MKERYLKYLEACANNNVFPLKYSEWLEKWNEEREVQ
jgi:hypothetical protein